MTEFTPTTEQVAESYVHDRFFLMDSFRSQEEAQAAFDRWLTQMRRAVEIDALRGFANWLDLDFIADRWSTNDDEHWAAGNAASEIQSAAFDLADQLEQEGKNDDLPYP